MFICLENSGSEIGHSKIDMIVELVKMRKIMDETNKACTYVRVA